MKNWRTRLSLTAFAAVLAAGMASPMAAAQIAQDDYQWAALGDSYTAGGFVGEPTPALGSPDRDGCDRTTNAYPDLVDRELEEFPPGRPVRLTNVSCGAAEISHIASDRQQPISPVDPPIRDGWSEVDTQVTRANLSDETDVVTVGVGGNSLPFGGMLTNCIRLGAEGKSCREFYENPPEGEENIDTKLARIQDEYIEMLAGVHNAAPSAKVITVGYPAVLPERAEDCAFGDVTELFTIRSADIDWLRGVLGRLNQTIQTVSGFFGDRYVDVHSSSIDHDACQPAEEKWVEGTCGNAEAYWPALYCPEGTRATLVHPNAAGHANTAQHVERAIRIALLEN